MNSFEKLSSAIHEITERNAKRRNWSIKDSRQYVFPVWHVPGTKIEGHIVKSEYQIMFFVQK